nr:uncharacterized protein I206_02299 [Kwoniella pini CBS 10737]OCF51584.1 hypothetical protein I206_02299 [Kwoniella pini CBS 10737]
MGFKKKFSSLIPADARNHLQNALTVEWEGQGKTVLVDLPETNKHQNNEVEMAGLTSNSAAYGRLIDDDDDIPYSRPSRSDYHNYSKSYQSTTHKHRKSPSYSSKNLPPIPPNQSESVYTYNQNPFETEYESPQTSSSSSMFSNNSPYTTYSPSLGNQASFGINEGYNNGSLNRKMINGGGERKMPNPWSKHREDDIDFLGDLGGVRNGGLGSPTSSNGTRDSQGSGNYNSLDNPFR